MSTQSERAADLLRNRGTTFCADAGIAVERNTPSVLWQLLELSLLHSARISAELAMRATVVVRKAFPTAQKLADAPGHDIWAALEEGDYLRKNRTADQLHQSAGHAIERWRGDLRKLRADADGDAKLAAELLQEFDGIGEVGAEIFLREVQGAWPEFAPFAGARVLDAARANDLPADAGKLAALVAPQDVPGLMAALVRTGLQKG